MLDHAGLKAMVFLKPVLNLLESTSRDLSLRVHVVDQLATHARADHAIGEQDGVVAVAVAAVPCE